MDARELGRQYGAVLERMVELLGAGTKGVTLGSALDQASAELGLRPPPDVEALLLVSAFKIIATGRVPGCPDA